jgi:hypothetical protein
MTRRRTLQAVDSSTIAQLDGPPWFLSAPRPVQAPHDVGTAADALHFDSSRASVAESAVDRADSNARACLPSVVVRTVVEERGLLRLPCNYGGTYAAAAAARLLLRAPGRGGGSRGVMQCFLSHASPASAAAAVSGPAAVPAAMSAVVSAAAAVPAAMSAVVSAHAAMPAVAIAVPE